MGSCTRVALPADEFETMKARVRRYRARVDEIGAISGPVIEENVQARIRGRAPHVDPLHPPQAELADEIVAFLNTPELSADQAALLALTFLGAEDATLIE